MQNPPLKFTLRCSGNFCQSSAVVVDLRDPQGTAAMLVTSAQFEAAQHDPRAAQELQKFRFARQLQIQAAFMQVSQRLIADLEAQEPHWPEFDRSYA